MLITAVMYDLYNNKCMKLANLGSTDAERIYNCLFDNFNYMRSIGYKRFFYTGSLEIETEEEEEKYFK